MGPSRCRTRGAVRGGRRRCNSAGSRSRSGLGGGDGGGTRRRTSERPVSSTTSLLDPAKIDEAKSKRAAMEEERRLHGDGGMPCVPTNDAPTSWLMTRVELAGTPRRRHSASPRAARGTTTTSDCSATGTGREVSPRLAVGRRGGGDWWRTASTTASAVTDWTTSFENRNCR